MRVRSAEVSAPASSLGRAAMRGLAVAVYSERRSAEVVAIAAKLAHAIAQRLDTGCVALVEADRTAQEQAEPDVALETLEELEPARIHGRLALLRERYRVLVVAVAGGWTERVFAILDASHRVLLVVEPTVASVRAVQRALKMCSSVGYSTEKVQLVLHGFSDAEAISSVEAVAALKRDVFAKLVREGEEEESPAHGYGSLAARLLESP